MSDRTSHDCFFPHLSLMASIAQGQQGTSPGSGVAVRPLFVPRQGCEVDCALSWYPLVPGAGCEMLVLQAPMDTPVAVSMGRSTDMGNWVSSSAQPFQEFLPTGMGGCWQRVRRNCLALPGVPDRRRPRVERGEAGGRGGREGQGVGSLLAPGPSPRVPCTSWSCQVCSGALSAGSSPRPPGSSLLRVRSRSQRLGNPTGAMGPNESSASHTRPWLPLAPCCDAWARSSVFLAGSIAGSSGPPFQAGCKYAIFAREAAVSLMRTGALGLRVDTRSSFARFFFFSSSLFSSPSDQTPELLAGGYVPSRPLVSKGAHVVVA